MHETSPQYGSFLWICKEAPVVSFKILSRLSFGGTKETHENYDVTAGFRHLEGMNEGLSPLIRGVGSPGM
jgi:hypothetical protein